jgi:hypothetical protein
MFTAIRNPERLEIKFTRFKSVFGGIAHVQDLLEFDEERVLGACRGAAAHACHVRG